MIVFLHGWGMNKNIFKDFVDKYLNKENVIMLDLPGYAGDSPSIVFDEQVSELREQIPQGAHLVAWSLGGLYALRMANLYPDQLSKLTMVCSTPSFAKKVGFNNALRPDVLDQFNIQLQQNRDKTIERFLLLQLHGQKGVKGIVKSIRKSLSQQDLPSSEVLEFGLQCLKLMDLRKELRKCTVPVHFILGEKDKIVPVAVEQDLIKINQLCYVSVLIGAAHLPFVTHPDLFNERVFCRVESDL